MSPSLVKWQVRQALLNASCPDAGSVAACGRADGDDSRHAFDRLGLSQGAVGRVGVGVKFRRQMLEVEIIRQRPRMHVHAFHPTQLVSFATILGRGPAPRNTIQAAFSRRHETRNSARKSQSHMRFCALMKRAGPSTVAAKSRHATQHSPQPYRTVACQALQPPSPAARLVAVGGHAEAPPRRHPRRHPRPRVSGPNCSATSHRCSDDLCECPPLYPR